MTDALQYFNALFKKANQMILFILKFSQSIVCVAQERYFPQTKGQKTGGLPYFTHGKKDYRSNGQAEPSLRKGIGKKKTKQLPP